MAVLLDAGADSNATDSLGRRPVDVARSHGKTENVKYLEDREE
jgi:ankyrin repeat protein